MNPLEYSWYNKSPLTYLLLPLSWLFCALAVARRFLYRIGLLKTHRLSVPVIVVGNISVGGTGKTPLVTWMIALLKQQGYRPGIISRGYGGGVLRWPQQVRPDADPRMVGDEAILLSRRCACPMAVGPDRVAAAQALLDYHDCDIIVSDDGLQHYALGRDVEIAVIDGVRRFGNGRCLPAGPLREPPSRLQQVQMVVANGVAGPNEYSMRLIPGGVWNLREPQQTRTLESFRGQKVHAVAGIGFPQRFFRQLAEQGIEVIEHPFRDHHLFSKSDLHFDDDIPVLMTEKDAVKCRAFAAEQHWCLPVDAELDDKAAQLLLRLIEPLIGLSKGTSHG